VERLFRKMDVRLARIYTRVLTERIGQDDELRNAAVR